MKIRDPKPEVLRLEELISEIRQGDIRLPKFQRPFVWQRSDVINLFDSIYNGYPIGSILLWNTNERLKSEREIEGFRLSDVPLENFPTSYLLDGQQRLTSLCATLYWDGAIANSIWNIAFDLDMEEFVYPKDLRSINYFPLNKLFSTSDFIKQCMAFESTDNSAFYYRRAERLLRAFKDYKIAVVKIGDLSLDQVAPIFERINSAGRKLTVVDLMRAATWKNGFDLSESIQSIKDECQYRFGEIADSQILRMIAASCDLGINKADIDKLRDKKPEQLNLAVDETRKALGRAVDFFVDHIHLPHVSFMPYGMQLNLIVEYFRLASNEGEPDKLARWFWRTSVSKYFGGANTGQLARDISKIRNFALKNTEDIDISEAVIDVASFLVEEFNLRTASSKVMALLLRREFELTCKGSIHAGIELSRNYYFDYSDKTSVFHGTCAAQVFLPIYLEGENFESAKENAGKFNFFGGDVEVSKGIPDDKYKNRLSVLYQKLRQLTETADDFDYI